MLGERPVGRQMQVREQRQVRMQQRILRLDRLLDLHQQFAFAPHLRGVGEEPRPDGGVGVVGEARTDAGAGLDEHVVPARHQLARAGRSERHPAFGLLDLLHDADLHYVTS